MGRASAVHVLGVAAQMAGDLLEARAAWPPDERPHYERTVARLTDAMVSVEFEQVRTAGQALASGAAVEYALAEPEH